MSNIEEKLLSRTSLKGDKSAALLDDPSSGVEWPVKIYPPGGGGQQLFSRLVGNVSGFD